MFRQKRKPHYWFFYRIIPDRFSTGRNPVLKKAMGAALLERRPKDSAVLSYAGNSAFRLPVWTVVSKEPHPKAMAIGHLRLIAC
jgi:hypothetical protein